MALSYVFAALALICGFVAAFLLSQRAVEWVWREVRAAEQTAVVGDAFSDGNADAVDDGERVAGVRDAETGAGRGTGTAPRGFAAVAARVLRNGIPALLPVARRLVALAPVASFADEAALMLRARGFLAPREAFVSVCLGCGLVVGVLGALVTGSPVFGVAAFACLLAVGIVVTNSSREKRAEATRESVPDALRAMGVCFQSGFSLPQTLEQVSRETHGDLGALFHTSAHVLQTGGSTEEALAVFASCKAAPELAFVSVALDVQHASGGSMRPVLEAARDMVGNELELARSLRVQTAQAKLSARVVSVMPFVLLALFSFVSPGFLDPFFESPAGIGLLCLALGMQFAGIMAVRRLLKVGD